MSSMLRSLVVHEQLSHIHDLAMVSRHGKGEPTWLQAEKYDESLHGEHFSRARSVRRGA